MAHDVFISYSSKDKPIADAICANLESTGVRCWIAPRDIAPGEDWPAAISKAISQSRVMVLVFSAHSNSSEDVGRELILAANSKLVIIPFKIENVEPEPGKQYYLARTHWLDAINPPTREQIHLLVKTVRAFIPAGAGEARPGVDGTVRGLTGTNLPNPAPRKKASWLLILSIPALILLLGAAGWLAFSLLTRQTAAPPTEMPATSEALDWNVNISDSFNSNIYSWPVQNGYDDGCSALNSNIKGGSLVWDLKTTENNQCGYLYYPAISAVSDFDVSMDIKRISGNSEAGYGLGFRIVDSENHFSFVISDTTRNFTVKRIQNNITNPVINWTYNSVIATDGYNHLRINGRGSNFYFYINDVLVGNAEIPGISSGIIGVVAEIFSAGDVSISFDNFNLQGL